jgi:hypothetical protein
MTPPRTARPLATLAVLLAATALSTGCESRSRELQAGSYRAVIELPGGELPFGLDVAIEDGRPVLYLVNGEERLRAADTTVADGRVTATLPGGGSTLTARVNGRRLEGEVELRGRQGGSGTLPLRADLGLAWRFFETPTSDNADVAGRWQVTFIGEQGPQGTGVAEFAQSFERVTGNVSTPAGVLGPLVGEMHGDELHLSRFDGATATLWRGHVNEDGALVGEFWSGTGAPQRFRAVRSPPGDPELPSPT